MLFTSLMRVYLTRSLKPFTFKNTYSNTLDFEQEKELGLYVHIPFCRSLCSFCPYCKELYNTEKAKQYKKALIKEIELVGSQMESKKEVTSLYFGGGTPALMQDDIKDIIACIKQYFIIKDGIGLELHPDDITKTCLETLKKAGVTMVSVGIQSFNQNCLQVLGRDGVDFTQKLALVRQAGFDVVDVDLIFAIPGQTKDILISDIETAFSNGATQISTYPFIDFTFVNNQQKPLSEKNKKEMLFAIADYCKKSNRNRTSVWTFAKENTGKYSSVTRDSFLGFGVSATSLLKKQFKINTFSIEDYINRVTHNNLPTSLTLSFSLRQRAVYFLFWSFYSMKVDAEKFEQFFGVKITKLFGFELWICQKLKLITHEKNCYQLTDKGAYYYHFIEQVYTTAYIDKMWNISRTTPFPDKIILK